MRKIKKKKFKKGDIVRIKRLNDEDNYHTIEDIFKQGKTIYYLIRHFGRPTFMASDGPFYYRELEKIYLTQKEISNAMEYAINHYLREYGPGILNEMIIPKANITNSTKIKKRLGIK